MDFLKDVENFKKDSLRPAVTDITREDGSKQREWKDSNGDVKIDFVFSGKEDFMVPDNNPDIDIAIVLPGLLIGSQDVADDKELLSRHGVTHIINAATMVKNYFPETIKYLRIDILDMPSVYILGHLEKCNQFINEARSGGGSVLVHCNAGISRSSSIIIGYLMKTNGWSFDESLHHVRKVRPIVCPNEGFAKQLRSYKPNQSVL